MTGIALDIEVEAEDGGSAGATRRLVFAREPVVIGRARACEVCLPNPRVSARHAELRREGRDWFVLDLGSTNGTRLNGRRLPPEVPRLLRGGDALELGGFHLGIALNVPVDEATAVATADVGAELVRNVLRRFTADAGAPRLRVIAGLDLGREVELRAVGDVVRVGRSEDCELRLSDALVSREHARVRRDLGGLVLQDLGSLNATSVNGEAVAGHRRLRDRDELRVGGSRIAVSDPVDGAVAALEPLPDEAEVVDSALFGRARDAAEAAIRSREPGSPRDGSDASPAAPSTLDAKHEVGTGASVVALAAPASPAPRDRAEGRVAPSARATSAPPSGRWMTWLALGAGAFALGAGYMLWSLFAR